MKYTLAVALLAAGCGGDPPLAPDAATGPSPDADLDGPTGPKDGKVWISQIHGHYSLVDAQLLDAPFPAYSWVDGCTAGPSEELTSLPAGSITVTGTATPQTLVQPTPGAGYEAPLEKTGELFTAGATITVTATGAIVPAFTATVTAPEVFSNPVFPSSLSRSASASITWTPGSGTQALFIISYFGGTMVCRAPDTGSFTLTTAALALLPSSVTTASFIGYRENQTTTTAGPWTVYFRVLDGQQGPAVSVGP